MAKSVCIEASLLNIDERGKKNSAANNISILLDLLIGQYVDEKFVIIHAAPSPTGTDKASSSKSCDVDAKSPLLPESFKSIDEHIVANHAKQVVRMLPGGLDVIGIRLSCGLSEIANPTGELKLRRILNAIHKATSKSFMGLVESHQEKVIGCASEGKPTFSTLDLSNKNYLSQKDVKVQTSNWIEIDYTYHFDWPLYLKKDSISPSKWVSNMLLPWANSLKESLILIDGITCPNEEEPLQKQNEDSIPKRKGKHSLLDLAPPKVMKAEFLDKSFLSTSSEGKDEIAWTVAFSGTLSGRAFMHPKANHANAFEELKKDLVRSVHSRWEMHCDSLVGDWESTGLDQVVHEPPKRIYMEGGGLPVSLCDYLFPGDTAADACISAKELLGISIQEENVDETQEQWADPSSFLTAQTNQSASPESESSQELKATSNGNMILVFSAVIGMMAIGIAYLFFTSKISP